MSGLKVGDAAPELTLPDQDGKDVSLSSHWAQGPVVLFFYPADMTYGCTKEACAMGARHSDFTKAGAAAVFGVSKDDADKHTQFREKHKLPYTLLTDKDGQAQKAYKVKKQLLGLVPGRVTFVIGQDGKIAYVFSSALDFVRRTGRPAKVALVSSADDFACRTATSTRHSRPSSSSVPASRPSPLRPPLRQLRSRPQPLHPLLPLLPRRRPPPLLPL